MTDLRDNEAWRAWHDQYDDPDSGLSWRLRRVQEFIEDALDAVEGPVRVLSLCSGDGRDLLGVLERRQDAGRVSARLVELDPGLGERARERAAAGGFAVEVVTGDAGTTDIAEGAVPADLVLLVGIFGNVSDADIEHTLTVAPQLCAPGARLLWSRGRDIGAADATDRIREWTRAAGFTELDFVTSESGHRPSLGYYRLDAEPQSLVTGQRLFEFIR